MVKTKVFHMIGSLDNGGTQNVVLNMLKTSDKNKFEFYFGVIGSKIGDLESEILSSGGKIKRIPKNNGNYFSYFNNIKKVLLEIGNIAIFHSHMHLNNGITLASAKSAGVPVRVSHSHSIRRKDINYSIKYSIYEWVMRKKIKHFGNVFIASSFAAGNYMYGETFFDELGVIFPNAIDIELFQFSDISRNKKREELHLEDKLVLGNVGNLNKVKNHKLIIEIVENLQKENIDTIALIIGEGKDRYSLEKIINEKNLQDKVILLGTQSDISGFLSAMDIFIFPSLNEGFGIAALEAQANGVPVIISDGVPQDVMIKSNVERISLEAPVSEWVDAIKKLENSRIRENDLLYFQGYSNNESGKILEKIYTDALNKLNNIKISKQ